MSRCNDPWCCPAQPERTTPTLRGAIIRLKHAPIRRHGSMWRVTIGDRMEYVVAAIRSAIEAGKRHGTYYVRGKTPWRQHRRCLAQVERLS